MNSLIAAILTATLFSAAAAAPALYLLQAKASQFPAAEPSSGDVPPGSHEVAGAVIGDLPDQQFAEDLPMQGDLSGKAKHLYDFKEATADPVKFFLYAPHEFEPRYEGGGELSKCERKGGDYMFLDYLMDSNDRVHTPEEAEVFIVPCLFESYRRCTTTNHAEKPPPAEGEEALFETADRNFLYDLRAESRPSLHKPKENPHPEDFEDVPWVKPFDYDTEQCLTKVMKTSTFKANNGTDHAWVVADWAINFGRAAESELFKHMTIGRIEVVNEEAARISNRPTAVEQSRCSFVVPYASDLAYFEDWGHSPSYSEWLERKRTLNFRFEDRQYVLFCKADPCDGAIDATPLRRKSMELVEHFGDEALVAMERVPMDQFMDEVHDAKFCLVMRGDTPSSHSFYDALAANCIPILVSDQWAEVAGPFAAGRHGVLEGGLEHNDFTLQFTEQQFLNDLPAVAKEIKRVVANEVKLRALFDSLQNARRALLWSFPESKVSHFALHSARACAQAE